MLHVNSSQPFSIQQLTRFHGSNQDRSRRALPVSLSRTNGTSVTSSGSRRSTNINSPPSRSDPNQRVSFSCEVDDGSLNACICHAVPHDGSCLGPVPVRRALGPLAFQIIDGFREVSRDRFRGRVSQPGFAINRAAIRISAINRLATNRLATNSSGVGSGGDRGANRSTASPIAATCGTARGSLDKLYPVASRNPLAGRQVPAANAVVARSKVLDRLRTVRFRFRTALDIASAKRVIPF